jgi:hypothetical protein
MDRHRYNKRLVNRRARARKAKKKLQGKQGIDPGQASTAQGSIDPDSLESVSTGTDTRLGNSENNTYSPGVDTTANEEPYTIDDAGFLPYNPPDDYDPASKSWWKDFEDQ